MELRHQNHVLALAERASFRLASEAPSISQPALTKSLFQIEREVGHRLFDRHGQTVAPTVFGAIVADSARTVCGVSKQRGAVHSSEAGPRVGDASTAFGRTSKSTDPNEICSIPTLSERSSRSTGPPRSTELSRDETPAPSREVNRPPGSVDRRFNRAVAGARPVR
jgi:hypothetical protein